jgi:hypothetical protein
MMIGFHPSSSLMLAITSFYFLQVFTNFPLFVLSSTTITSTTRNENESTQISYGVDVSFPIQHSKVSTNYPWLPHNVDPENNPTPPEYEGMPLQVLGNRKQLYQNFIRGCEDYYPTEKESRRRTEADRVKMSLRQPTSMQNYMDFGFKKARMPDELWKLLKTFWDKNKDKKMLENWNTGNTYTNHWAAPTYMVSVENTSLRGGGGTLKQAVWDAARETIEEWTGQELTQCSLYGIRVYTEGM